MCYAIRERGTDQFMPQRKYGRGHTWSELTPIGESIPRLFKTKLGAKLALHHWRKGPMAQDFSQPTNYPYRLQKDLEIIEVTLCYAN